MSLDTWKAEFYPVRAIDCPEEDAVRHSVMKWCGLTAENLERHGLKQLSGGREIGDIEGGFSLPYLKINDSTCALCQYHYDDDALCPACPFVIWHGDTCWSAYSAWTLGSDPQHMIEALEALTCPT